MEERVARVQRRAQLVAVAEVGGVLRDDAVAEEAEDGRVLPLEPQLELGLVLVELVEMGHTLIVVTFAWSPGLS